MYWNILYEKDVSVLENFDSFQRDLCSIFDQCTEMGFTKEEIKKIHQPLFDIIRKALLIKRLKIISVLLILFTIVYFLFQTDTILWHLSAIGRLAMIQFLPVWKWEKLSNEKCLIPNVYKELNKENFDCILCEGISSIPVESNLNPYDLNEFYLDVNHPVIITNGLENWPPIFNSSFNMYEEIQSDLTVANSLPCELSTNMFTNLKYVGVILKKSQKFKTWFFHFQNCDLSAMKTVRNISPRPEFIGAEIAPIQYNWLLMSSNYNAPKFKKIHLIEKYAIFGQIKGQHFIRLIPRLNCKTECSVLEFELKEGEALVFTSYWDLEYKPNYPGNNTAIILETH